MISRELIEDMFQSIRAKTRWNIDGVCLWGYFFTDHDRVKLTAAIPALEKLGYRFVTIRDKPTPEDDDQDLLFLHVEKEEAHTVDTLLIRNAELDRFADDFDIETYDGMDVGPLPQK